MSKLSAYQELHLLFDSLPRMPYPYKPRSDKGFYILYQKGERTSHGLQRIVRVGNYSGTGRLFGEEVVNSKRSVLLRHLGKCLEAKNKLKGPALEQAVTRYLRENFSFVLLPHVPEGELSSRLYAGLIATLSQSEDRKCSKNWLGRWHPSRVVKEGCLWNIAHTSDSPLCNQEMLFLHEHLSKQNTKPKLSDERNKG